VGTDLAAGAGYEAERERHRLAGATVMMTVETRVPSRYRLLDLETGCVWQRDVAAGRWKTAELLGSAPGGGSGPTYPAREA
jgi:hypothetical protein